MSERITASVAPLDLAAIKARPILLSDDITDRWRLYNDLINEIERLRAELEKMTALAANLDAMQMEACEEARTIAERYGCFLGREMDSYERSALAKLRLIASDSDRAIAEGGTE